MSNEHITIQTCLKALGCTSYHDICSAYLTARLIIVYSRNDDYVDAILYSNELHRSLHLYREIVSNASTTEHIDKWVLFCTCLRKSKLHNDYESFLDMYTPYAVMHWQNLLPHFHGKAGNALVALILMLRIKPSFAGGGVHADLQNHFSTYASLYRRCGLDYPSFARCWNAVYTYPLLSSEIHRSTSIVKAAEIYRYLYLPMSDLLSDYATLVLSEKESMHRQATRGNRRKHLDCPTSENRPRMNM